jgi:guanylate kinase
MSQPPSPLLIVISGPSGVGKDSVLSRMKQRGLPFHYTVTATTRPRREVRPEDHEFLRFLTDDEFEELLSAGGLLEHANVYGKRYGVPKGPVREALQGGKDVIMRVDVQGAANVRRVAPAALLIFLAPRSLDDLRARLHVRGLDDPQAVERRIAMASEEMARRDQFDHVVVNDDGALEKTVDRVLDIIERERSRPDRLPVTL